MHRLIRTPLLVGVALIVGILALPRTQAGFSDQTSNTANTFAAASSFDLVVTVNSTGDSPDLSSADGRCDTGGLVQGINPECTLRAAIEVVNEWPSGGSVEFDIPTSDPGYATGPVRYTVAVGSELPTISSPIDLDATTQPGFAGTPIVELDGTATAADVDGLALRGGASTVRGLSIGNFGGTGIEVQSGDGNVIVGNYLGIGASGTAAMPNLRHGLRVDTASNIIGGQSAADRNVISANLQEGIVVDGAGATFNTVVGNYVGTDAAGVNPLGNSDDGIQVSNGASNNMVGGPGAGEGNLVSGNGDDGIQLNSGATANLVRGNYVGTDVTGSLPIANASAGMVIYDAANNTIGGALPAESNLISGNIDSGIRLDAFDLGGTTGNLVIGNRIGTDASGLSPLGNGRGVNIRSGASANTIGGGVPGEGNLISGNVTDGLYVSDAGTNANIIIGNYIGVEVTGTSALPNGDRGVQIESGATATRIGGAGSGEGNLISGNVTDGVIIGDGAAAGTTGTIVENNIIGAARDGIAPLGNGNNGIRVTAPGGSNSFLGNVVGFNGGLGIDLADSIPTPNDPGDFDSGPNGLLNYPVITGASATSGIVTVDFDLDVPVGTYRIDIFTNPAGADPTGYGQGQVFEGSDTVTYTGAESFQVSYTGAIDDQIVLTATEQFPGPAYGSTSEFSAVWVGPLHAWRLDGNASDSVGSLDGTLFGTTTVPGRFDDALNFDEVDDHIVIPAPSYPNGFSIAFDFKIDDNTGTLFKYLYGHDDVLVMNSINIFVNEAQHGTHENFLRTVVRDTNDTLDNLALQIDISSLIGDGLWHTYVLVVDPSTGLTAYVDGVMISDPTRGTDALNPTGPLYVGARDDLDPTRFHGGGLDALQIYDWPLTPAQVAARVG